MLYLIVAASLIYVSNAQCTGTGVTSGTDCTSQKGIAAGACTQSGGLMCYTVTCDDRVVNGFCTIECSSNTDCANAKAAMSMTGEYECDDTHDPALCKQKTPTPVQSSTKAPSTFCDTIDYTCTTDTDCDPFVGCMSPESITAVDSAAETSKCIMGPVGKICTITCNSGDSICDVAETELVNFLPDGVPPITLVCNPPPNTSGDKTCGLPVVTSPPDNTGTLPPLDITCTEPIDCETNLDALVYSIAKMTPKDLGLEYLCLNKQCTVTCGPLNLCQQVQDAINGELEPKDHIVLECAKAEGTEGKDACIPAGTGYPDTTSNTRAPDATSNTASNTENTPDTTILDCNDEPCDDNERPDCVPGSVDDMCSVRVEFDLDVCRLHKGMKRDKIFEEIKGACIQFTGPAIGVCDGGFWSIEAYECSKQSGSTFDFDQAPGDESECPQNVQGNSGKSLQAQCTDTTTKNAAHIKGAAGLFCPCGDDDDQALIAIRDSILKNAEKNLDFAKKFTGLSETDDEICHKGFIAVEVNTLTITFRNADGQVVGEVIDITGGCGTMYYYIASLVVLVVVTFL